VFCVSVPFGVAALLLGIRLLPRHGATGAGRRLDLVGAGLLGLGVVAVLLPVIQAGEAESTPTWWLLAVGFAIIGLFLVWEQRLEQQDKHPLVKLKLLSMRSNSTAALTGFCFFAAQPSIFALYFIGLADTSGNVPTAVSIGMTGTTSIFAVALLVTLASAVFLGAHSTSVMPAGQHSAVLSGSASTDRVRASAHGDEEKQPARPAS
jgi:hypothetical protein